MKKITHFSHFSLVRTSNFFRLFCFCTFAQISSGIEKTGVHNSAFETLQQNTVTGASLKAVCYPATFQDFPPGHHYRLSLHHYSAAQVSREFEFLQHTPEQNLTIHLLRARQPQIPPSPCLDGHRILGESCAEGLLPAHLSPISLSNWVWGGCLGIPLQYLNGCIK